MTTHTPQALGFSQQLPRYTSYPTAPHFAPLTATAYASWLSGLPADAPASLYLHVPYCKKLCWFCGCHTRITERYEPVQGYSNLLVREMALVHQAAGRKLTLSHMHWGGGSPTYIKPFDFAHCMEGIGEYVTFTPNAEIAIEIDPRNVTEAHVAAYAKHGVNRVSLGVQDCNEEVQQAINRIQPLRMVYDLVQTCRDYGISSINLDLIYGLPRQSEATMQETIEQVLLLKPSRIALFGYAHVPWKKKNIRLIEEETLPDETLRLKLFSLASQLLHDAGYVSIGLDHFARPDDSMAIALRNHTLQRNFQGYTTDTASSLIGLGASAIGNFSQGFAQNNPSIEDYARCIEEGTLPIAKGFAFCDDDKIRRAIIGELMCYLKADIADICSELKVPVSKFDDAFLKLRHAEAQGWLAIDGHSITINPELPQAVRVACAAFDAYYQPAAMRHSQVA